MSLLETGEKANSCDLCGRPCVKCKGGRCKCGFDGYQVYRSNWIIKEELVDIEDEGAKEGLIYLVRTNLTLDELVEAIENGTSIEEAKQKYRDNEQRILQERKDRLAKRDVVQTGCKYPEGKLGAWEKCERCGRARFYDNGSDCPNILQE